MSPSRDDRILLDNFLDEDFQTLFQPFNIMQWMFLLPKYRFYENILVFNSRKVDFISSLSFIIPTSIFITRSIMYPVFQFNVTYNVLVLIDFTFFCLGFLISFTLNLCYRKLHAGLVLNIQSLFKMYKLKDHINISMFNAISWSAIVVTAIYVTLIFAVYINISIVVPFDFVLSSYTIHSDMNIIFACRVVNLIDNHFGLWLSELGRLDSVSLVQNNTDLTYNVDYIESSHISVNSEGIQGSVREEWKRLLKGYRKIFKTYDMYKKTFQIHLLYHGLRFFLSATFFVQYSIEFIYENPNIKIAYYNISICMIAFKNLVLLFFICYTNQSLYTNVERAQRACLNVIKSREHPRDDEAVRTCKNIVRMNAVVFARMQACGAFAVDARAPLRFVSVVAEYVIVLIQFALGRK